VVTTADRCDDVDTEQFTQRPGGCIAVEMRYGIARFSGDVLFPGALIVSFRG
jgi:hypothetical protein